ncbi:zinc/cadmium/mercury/lead-transporting ATPase [Erwinia persicina]|uniref:zinc/cadmium/mercury/lead-transporting ATPase n=1 Tax=Erwinia persicina TaxID=55211 RepID=UPI00210BEC3C|nr:zinc/cadmium/mercury/lead-transporting ATPase [Erwinia persicina]MCQ4093822.1 zinc/cadmium/mercury/lead-transporting ATPase [Erwinia persicina]MCQ4101674.1 zinc/cadmium/mercury/lead-transporting ATPase [Erwinia persicina]
MQQHSSCGCGHHHASTQHGCSTRPRPVIQKITPAGPSGTASPCCEDTACHSGNDPDDEGDRPSGDVRFTWQVKGMDCPACARKVETAIKQLPEIVQARVAFASEKLLVDARSDVREAVEQAVSRAGFQLQRSDAAAQPAVEKSLWQENLSLIVLTLMMAVSWLLESINHPAGQIAFIATTLFGVWPIGRSALRLMRSGSPFSIETLMTVAAVGALFIGATAEAAMVLLLFMLGERLESFAAGRARKGVTALMALKPDTALRLRAGQRENVAVSDLRPGDVIEVAAGARLPADAKLLSRFASFDESALTGESVPVERQQNETIAAGCLSVDRLVQLEVMSEPGKSAIDRILHLIEEAEERRAPIERFLDRFSRIYTPVIIVLSLGVVLVPPLLLGAAWQPWIYKGLTLLLIGCPCALVISTPAAITSGLAAAARRGALIKGGAVLESLGSVRTMAFDKTGTLTEGKPQVTAILPLAAMDEEQLLATAAAIEQGSSHPLAKAIISAAAKRQLTLPLANDQRALAGSGVEAEVSGRLLTISSPSRLPDGMLKAERGRTEELENAGNTVVVLHDGQQMLGLIALRDTLRADARAALDEIRALGIHAVMLTGDNPRAAAAIAGELDIDYRAGLLPEDKVTAISQLNQQQPVAMVGDGINDAPAMKAATVGIAMGGGSDVALETADAALTHNRLNALAAMIRLSRATHANIRQNVALALGLKGIFLITTLMGITGLWLAVLADSGATALVTANALRLLRKK